MVEGSQGEMAKRPETQGRCDGLVSVRKYRLRSDGFRIGRAFFFVTFQIIAGCRTISETLTSPLHMILACTIT